MPGAKTELAAELDTLPLLMTITTHKDVQVLSGGNGDGAGVQRKIDEADATVSIVVRRHGPKPVVCVVFINGCLWGLRTS